MLDAISRPWLPAEIMAIPNPISIRNHSTEPPNQSATMLCPTNPRDGDWCTDTRHECVPCVKSDMSSDMSRSHGYAYNRKRRGRDVCDGELSILLHMQHADCWGTMRNMQDLLMWSLDTASARMTWGLFLLFQSENVEFNVVSMLSLPFLPVIS